MNTIKNTIRNLTALIALSLASSSYAQTNAAPATIFEHTNFGGKSQALVEGMNVGPLALGNDVASSVKVSKCFKVTLYGAAQGQNGPELVLTADDADLVNDNFNDIVSNVLVERVANCAAAPAEAEAFKGVAGTWQFEKPTNDWHYVTISSTSAQNTYKWKNKAGKEWTCLTTVARSVKGEVTYALTFQADSPYPNVQYWLIRDRDGNLIRLEEYVDGTSGQTKSILIKK